jgi:hypothetical protein
LLVCEFEYPSAEDQQMAQATIPGRIVNLVAELAVTMLSNHRFEMPFSELPARVRKS